MSSPSPSRQYYWSPLLSAPAPGRLLIFLCLVALWDGFELGAWSQTLPSLRASFGMSVGQGGQLVALANVGTIFGYFLLRQADRIGRRPVLLLSALGYTLAGVASGAASGLGTFLAAQFLSRIFIVSALATAMVFAVEEFSVRRRGLAIGTVVTSSSIGVILCAVVTPHILASRYGWRGVYYLVGPMLLLAAYGLFRLPETARFRALRSRVIPSLFTIWRAGHGRRILACSLLWIFTFATNQSAVTFWKEHAVANLGMSDKAVGAYMAVGSLVAIPASAAIGPLLDRFGRRASAVPVYLMLAAGVVGSYRLPPGILLWLAIVPLMSGAGCALVVAHTLTAESVPTAQRGDAMAWANSLLGRIGFIFSPLIVAAGAQGAGWAATMPWVAASPLLAIILVSCFFPSKAPHEPETRA